MWSTAGAAFKLTLRYADPINMLFYASIVSVTVLFLIMVIQKKTGLLSTMDRGDVRRSALLGILNPFLFYIVLFNAYDLLLTQEAMVLNFTWPVTLTLLSIIFLKQKIGWKNIAAILVSFCGILLIATNGKVTGLDFSNPEGVALALGSTVIWSLFWIFNIKDKRDEVIKLFLNFSFGIAYILIFMIFTGQFQPPRLEGIAGSFYIGIFEMGVAYVLWLKALQLSETTAHVSNLIFLAPFLSLVFINIVVGEPILISTLAGLAFIITGILMQRYWK